MSHILHSPTYPNRSPVSFLMGDALNWAMPLVECNGLVLQNCVAFLQEFTIMFSDPHPTWKVEITLQPLHQRECSIMAYASFFCGYATDTQWKEVTQLYSFCWVLREEMKDELA